MTTATVKVGDIIEVDKNGRMFFALVTRVGPIGASLTDHGRFGFKPLSSGVTYRGCNAREIVGHYRRSKASRVPAEVAL